MGQEVWGGRGRWGRGCGERRGGKRRGGERRGVLIHSHVSRERRSVGVVFY